MTRFDAREHGASILVAVLGSTFGVALLQVTGLLSAAIAADDVTGSSDTVAIMLTITAAVFIVVAIYVSAIVTANTFATIIAGRTRTIALLRLVGSSAGAQRRAVAREGLVVGVIGAVVGAVVGTALAAAGAAVAVATDTLPATEYSYLQPVLVLPVLAVIVTTWLASWVGSRRVLTVTPMQAIGGARELSVEEVSGRPARNAVSIVLFAIGGVLLALGVVVGLVSPLGVFIGLIGGILSFTGLVTGAHLVMPRVLRLLGRVMGRSAAGRLAAENAVRYPERSSRTTIGLVIGVTLVVMFAVAMASYSDMIRAAQREQPEVYAGIDEMLTATIVVFSVLIGFSALIAAVGMVNNLSLSVVQRTRELGLLRALGFTARQVRRMILAESAQLTIAAVVTGVVLGFFYGWVGAQSLLGSINGSPGVIVPGIPWVVLGVVVVAAAVLTWAAAVTPARRATRVSPVVALAVD